MVANDSKQLFLFGLGIPGSEGALFDRFFKIFIFPNESGFFRIQESSRYRNKELSPSTTEALQDIPADDILQLVVGPNHVAFLFKVFYIYQIFYL